MATAAADPLHQQEEEGAPPAPPPASPPRTHACAACAFPIAAYGRLVPCKHAFCLACASGHALCFLCQSTIARVERVEGPLFISPVTLESFYTAAELDAHLAAARSRLAPIRVLPPPSAGPPPPGGVPFAAGPPVMHRRPPPPPVLGAPGGPLVLALPGLGYGGG